MNFFAITPFLLQAFIWIPTWVVLRFFGKIVILGKENIHRHKHGAIFAVNHSSQLDPILIPATLNPFSPLFPMFYLSRERSFYKKSGLVKYIYGGLFFKIWGAYPAVAGSGDYEHALKNQLSILDKGKSVCVFPEGRRNLEGGVKEGKPGVAYLSWRTGRLIIPVAIRGHLEMGPGDFFARKHQITISYGSPVTREELFGVNAELVSPSHEDLKAASQVVMSRIREMYEKI